MAIPSRDMVSVEWEEDYTVYHRRSGETHLLSPLPMEVLHLLQTRPLSLRELSTELAKLCEVAFDDGWLKKIQGILLDLEKLSLVERKPFICHQNARKNYK